MLSFQQQSQPQTATQQVQQTQQQQQQPQSVQDTQHVQQNPAIQTMRLRDDPPPITPAPRTSRKRKSPPTTNPEVTQQPPPPPPPQQQQPMQHVLPPPHALIHPIAGPMPPGFPYPPTDYTPGGIPPPHPSAGQHPPGLPPTAQQQQQQSAGQQGGSGGRALSNSKRAEQNRKAQRAFRERRDQHVKALESRSQLLDAALASADEANRRWEECRALVDQLRVENAALRAALSQAQLLPPSTPNPPINVNGTSTNPGEESKEPDSIEPIHSESKDPAAAKKD